MDIHNITKSGELVALEAVFALMRKYGVTKYMTEGVVIELAPVWSAESQEVAMKAAMMPSQADVENKLGIALGSDDDDLDLDEKPATRLRRQRAQDAESEIFAD